MQACSPASAVHSPNFCRSISTTVRLSTTKWGASHHRVQDRPSKQDRLICRSSKCEPTTILPNGLAVCYASKYDVDFLYREIFTEKAYLQHGIQLAEGNVVIDVGGNIGFFALFAAEYVGSHGTVITAEPIPDLLAKLQYNVQSHLQWCASRGWSTMYADDSEVEEAMQVFLDNALSGLQGIEVTPLTKLGQFMQNSAPEWLSRPVKRLFVQNMLNQKQHYTCKMTTVSSIMQQHNLQHVDLLKIDVERAELDVLMGIAEDDFLKIKQIVMELHDIDERLKQVASLLKTTGKFDKIVVTQGQQLKGSTLFNMYCSRSEGSLKAHENAAATQDETPSHK